MEKIALVGAGGHAKTIVDTIEYLGKYEIAGFITPSDIGKELYRGYRVIGHDDEMNKIYASGVQNAVIAIGFMGKTGLRNEIYEKLKIAGFYLPVIIDPSAIVAKDAKVDEGAYIGRRVVINADAHIGKACIINTGAIVEHECMVGDFSHVAVAATLCGQARIGENTFIGANATVLQCCKIGNNCIVGAGSVVTKDIIVSSISMGVPARITKVRE